MLWPASIVFGAPRTHQVLTVLILSTLNALTYGGAGFLGALLLWFPRK
jgi:hypothetical protein